MALEQNEIKKVISVDLGNTTTSLKEYKQHIDELRGSLLQLDEASAEYQEIAKEIKAEQDKLNEVMKVGKTVTDAADGSYNQLVQTMSELKKQWRATGDEAERAELGQQILNINNKLKDLDASTGNYQRNVGDYANAFEQAFGKCMEGISRIDGPLGELGGTVKQMIPVIKSINATALTGLSGIKKAIASTGIGLLVVAVGELVAHWEDVKKAVGNLIGVQDSYTSAVEASKRAMEAFKEEVKAANKEIEFQDKLLMAQGVNRLDRLKNKEAEQKEVLNGIWEEYNREIEFFNMFKDASSKSQRRAAEDAKKRADEKFELIKAQEELINQTKENIKIEQETLEKAARDRIKAIEESLLTESEKLKAQYDKDIELANQYGLDTVAITEKYNKDVAALNAKAQKDKQNAKKTDSEILLEQQKKEAEQILARVHAATTDELVLLEETYNKEKSLLESLGQDTVGLTQEYEDKRKKVIEKEEEENLKTLKDFYSKQNDLATAEAEQRAFYAEMILDDEQALATAKYNIEQDLLSKKIALQEQFISEYTGNEEGLKEAEAELDAMRLQYANNFRRYEKDSADFAKKKAEEVKQAKMASLNATLGLASSVFGALADMSEEGSQQQKNLQIAETTINTLAGAVGAFLQGLSSYPAPYGAIVGAASAAAATAAGIAQIAKIKAVTTNSSGSVASPQVQAPSMTSVSPLLDETMDINRLTTLNEQGNSAKETQNLRVYVVEQDIRDANHKVQVVEQNTTF